MRSTTGEPSRPSDATVDGEPRLVVRRDPATARLAASGPGAASPDAALDITLLHGFTQTAASWSAIVEALTVTGHACHRPDLPGHGASASVQAGLWHCADLVAAVMPRRSVLVGYSMGARIALHVALAHPERLAGLVCISGTAGIEGADERRARRAADEALARSLERDGVAAFLERWLAQPLFAGLPLDAPGRAERVTNTVAGLAGSLRTCGTGSQEPLAARLHAVAPLPVLLVAGRRDAKFVLAAARLETAIGTSARTQLIDDAGHACHHEQPAAVIDAISEFCSAIASPTAEGGPTRSS